MFLWFTTVVEFKILSHPRKCLLVYGSVYLKTKVLFWGVFGAACEFRRAHLFPWPQCASFEEWGLVESPEGLWLAQGH